MSRRGTDLVSLPLPSRLIGALSAANYPQNLPRRTASITAIDEQFMFYNLIPDHATNQTALDPTSASLQLPPVFTTGVLLVWLRKPDCCITGREASKSQTAVKR